MVNGVIFRVLGPVGMEIDGRPLDVGPRQRRGVLAALVMDAGEPVPIDTLAQRVWGASAPEAPRSALYAHLTRLKRVLAQAGDAQRSPISLSRHGDGYVLAVDRQLVDLHRFQTLVEASRAEPHPTRRSGLLREALDLWRGRPLSGLTSDWAAQVRTSAESQFIGAAAAWATEELRLAHPAAVADRLAHLVSAYPLAEPLVVLLMRALCAMGRPAEALQRYAETRARLVDQLGAEPGLELRNLHLTILRGEFDHRPEFDHRSVFDQRSHFDHQPQLDHRSDLDQRIDLDQRTGFGHQPQRAPGGGPGSQPPRQLPADLSRFTGQARELEYLTAWAASSSSDGAAAVLAIHGQAGVGKSALAIHAAHRLADRYPDGQLYLDLRGTDVALPPLDPAEGLARLLRALGIAPSHVPDQPDEAAVLFRSMVAGRRLLLVLDNAVDAAQVRPLLPAGSGCATLATSRRALVGLGDIAQVHLAPLGSVDGVRLLGRWIGAARVAAEPAAAASIVAACAGLPLAICAAGARLAARPAWPLAELAGRLADPRRRLDHLEFDGSGVRASLAAAVQQLAYSADPVETAAAMALPAMAAATEPEFDSAEAAHLLARPRTEVEAVLERLVDAQLLQTSAPGRYRMDDLVRLYALEWAARARAKVAPSAPRPVRQDVAKAATRNGSIGDDSLGAHPSIFGRPLRSRPTVIMADPAASWSRSRKGGP